MRICKECGSEVIEKTYTLGGGMDGNSYCTGCGQIEPDTIEVIECYHCGYHTDIEESVCQSCNRRLDEEEE